MTPARRRALSVTLVGIAILAAVLIVGATWREPKAPGRRPAAERPALMLLTSLPLLFDEGFSPKGGSPALTALQTRYRVVPISVTSPSELAKGRLLLMAQPLAQTAENLVALDDWVRRGGRVLLLADPMLEWPSQRPLGDPLRPPPMFADTGLLVHWGLRLDAPERRGPRKAELGGFAVLAISPGALFGHCRITSDHFVATCRVGAGKAIVIADADFIGGRDSSGDIATSLDGLLAELAELESK